MRKWSVDYEDRNGKHIAEEVVEGATLDEAISNLEKRLEHVPLISEITDAPFALRMYYFTLRHLSPLHRGIQADHAQTEMWLTYNNAPVASLKGLSAWTTLSDWAKYYKTAIILDGGTSQDLTQLLRVLEDDANVGYPFEALSACIIQPTATGLSDAQSRNRRPSPDPREPGNPNVAPIHIPVHEPDMNGCITAVAVVLPPEVYGWSPELAEDDPLWGQMTPWQQWVAEFKSKCRLASG